VSRRDDELMISLATAGVFVWNRCSGTRTSLPPFHQLEVRARFFPDDEGVLLLAGSSITSVARLDRQGGLRWIAVEPCADVALLSSQTGLTCRGQRIDFVAGTATPVAFPDGVAVSADGSLVATSSAVFATATAKAAFSLDLTGHEPIVLGFSPDLTTLASVGEEGRLVLFDVATGLVRAVVPGCKAAALAFSPDGHLVAGGDGARVRLWSRDGRDLGGLVATGTTQDVRALWFVDKRLLVADFGDQSLVIFDVNRKVALASLSFYDRGRWMATGPDGVWEGDPDLGPASSYRRGWLVAALRGYSPTEPTRSISASGRSSW